MPDGNAFDVDRSHRRQDRALAIREDVKSQPAADLPLPSGGRVLPLTTSSKPTSTQCFLTRPRPSRASIVSAPEIRHLKHLPWLTVVQAKAPGSFSRHVGFLSALAQRTKQSPTPFKIVFLFSKLSFI